MPCPTTHGRQSPVRARFVPGPSRSCNSSDTAIAIPRVSRAYRLARWHRFVSIERRQPLQTALQGISARAMVCRKVSELPRTAVSARSLTFLQFIWHGTRHSTGLQGTSARAMIFRNSADLPRTALRARSHTFLQFILHPNRLSTGLQGTPARAMASICVHRALRTLPDIAPGHIDSRDGLQEFGRPATHGPQSPVPHFPAIHLAPQSPFYRPTGHIAHAMASICVHRATRTPLDSTPGHIRSRDGLQEDHRPATHGRAGPASPFPAIHLTRQSPFYGPAGYIRSRDGLQEDHRPATHGRAGPAFPFPAIHLARQSPFYESPGHIDSRDGINLCPSSVANPSRQHSRAHRLARWFAGRSPTCHAQPCRHCIPLSCNSPDKAIAFLRASREH